MATGKGRAPDAPSLDQIKPGIGYTKDNVQVICVGLNLAKNTWGLEIIAKLLDEARAHGTLQ
jgi:hypothetical protein